MTAKILGFYDTGARHFIFVPATGGSDSGLVLDRLFADVVPTLHEHDARSRRSTHGEGQPSICPPASTTIDDR